MVKAMLNAIKVHAAGSKASGSVYDRVGGRIYSPSAPDQVRCPYIVFVNQGTVRNEGYGFAFHEMSIRFVIYTDAEHDMTSAENILDALEDRFAWQSLTVSGGNTVYCRPEVKIGPTKIDGRIQAAQDFTFTVQE